MRDIFILSKNNCNIYNYDVCIAEGYCIAPLYGQIKFPVNSFTVVLLYWILFKIFKSLYSLQQ